MRPARPAERLSGRSAWGHEERGASSAAVTDGRKALTVVAEALLASWRDTPTRRAIVGFVERVTAEGDPGFVVPAERVDEGTDLLYKATIDFFDDGPEKPVRIWSRIGRRPLVAGGNSNGDVPLLRFARHPGRDALRLLVLHDDPDREFDYVAGAEDALDRARERSWTVISVKADWATVFPDT
jgi:hypothetical protein